MRSRPLGELRVDLQVLLLWRRSYSDFGGAPRSIRLHFCSHWLRNAPWLRCTHLTVSRAAVDAGGMSAYVWAMELRDPFSRLPVEQGRGPCNYQACQLRHSVLWCQWWHSLLPYRSGTTPTWTWDVATAINLQDVQGVAYLSYELDAAFQSTKEIETPLGMDDWRWERAPINQRPAESTLGLLFGEWWTTCHGPPRWHGLCICRQPRTTREEPPGLLAILRPMDQKQMWSTRKTLPP